MTTKQTRSELLAAWLNWDRCIRIGDSVRCSQTWRWQQGDWMREGSGTWKMMMQLLLLSGCWKGMPIPSRPRFRREFFPSTVCGRRSLLEGGA